MADYSVTPLAKKLGIKEGHSVVVIGGPSDLSEKLAPLPPGARVARNAKAPVDVILLFTTSASELGRRFASLAKDLAEDGGFWIAWPKKAGKVSNDLSFEIVQERGLEDGLVDNKSCSIDETWQALRFVYRIGDRSGRK